MANLTTIKVDESSGIPPYEQVRRGLSELIASGALTPGAKLPAVRQLAGDLGLAVNTVARAYRELEEAGAVVTRRRAGTHVAFGVSPRHQIRMSAVGSWSKPRERTSRLRVGSEQTTPQPVRPSTKRSTLWHPHDHEDLVTYAVN